MAIYLTGLGPNAVLVSYGGTDLTNHVKSITINQTFDTVETTAMNASNKSYAVGLQDASVDIEFYQDYAASSVDQTLSAQLGVSAGATLIIQTNGATINATNPRYVGLMALYDYTPIDASVGDASMTKVTFKPASGQTFARLTS